MNEDQTILQILENPQIESEAQKCHGALSKGGLNSSVRVVSKQYVPPLVADAVGGGAPINKGPAKYPELADHS